MAERKFMGVSFEPLYAADKGGGGGGTPAPDPKEVARDESIHRSAYLIQGTPVSSSHTPAPTPKADTSETGMPAIIQSLRDMGIQIPPAPAPSSGEGEGSSSGGSGSGY